MAAAEATIVLAVVFAAQRVVAALKELKSLQKFNLTIVQEIDQFINSLNENIVLLQEQLPNKSGSWALESLQTDLDKTREELDDGLKNGDFKKFWDAKQIKDKLDRLRQNLINKFQVKLFITSLEVAINADERMDNFESRMLELSAMSAARNPAAITEIRKLLQPLVVGMRRQDQRLQSFVSMVQGNEVKVETSSETQKFLEDVLANLNDLTEEEPSVRPRPTEDDRDEYLDPITNQLMNDPVKCTDGQTYDRFSVLEYNLTQKEPLVIACDDINVRRKLFEKFGEEGVESNFRNLRMSYRDEALTLANKGHSAEALRMLKNVLQWTRNDRECLEMKDQLEHEIAMQQIPVVTQQAHLPSAPAIDYLPTPERAKILGYENREPQQQNMQSFAVSRQPENYQPQQQNMDQFAVSIIIMVLCFPCSICCIPCLFPNCCDD